MNDNNHITPEKLIAAGFTSENLGHGVVNYKHAGSEISFIGSKEEIRKCFIGYREVSVHGLNDLLTLLNQTPK